MILTINTKDREKIEIGLVDNLNHKTIKFNTLNQSDDILNVIINILVQYKTKINDINAILVHEGPGSYTGVRVGITVANTLAWSLNKPTLGYNNDNFKEILKIAQKQKKFSKIALPKY